MRIVNPKGIAKAKAARKEPSVAEAVFWKLLRSSRHGYKFRREVPVGPYRLDFYCHAARLAVELDGEQLDAQKDGVRDQYLSELGILVYRIPNRELFGLDEGWGKPYLNEILEPCHSRTS